MEPLQSIRSRAAALGALPVWRALPVRERRLIGPWCFLDRYGPITFSDDKAMDVAPHPHIGLQTVSWLVDGEVVHHDSLGYEATVKPGGVNVMTAGSGISHSEETPRRNSGRLDGVQLWIALPDAQRNTAPAFQHVPEVPQIDLRGATASLFAGAFGKETSPSTVYSDIIGLDINVHARGSVELPLDATREHGVFILGGSGEIEGQQTQANTLYYAAPGRSQIALRSADGARVLLIGGQPFRERVLMWWNFVARTPEEVAAARADWEEHRRFGEVASYSGRRIEAPPPARVAAPANPAS